jgi:hypothetical protein
MRFITDQAVDQIAALQDVDAAGRQQAFDDADTVYHYLRRSEGQRSDAVPEDALRKWGEQNDLGPDRLNLALEVLRETGRVVAVA